MQVISPKRSPGPSIGDGIVVVQIHRRIDVNPVLRWFPLRAGRSVAASGGWKVCRRNLRTAPLVFTCAMGLAMETLAWPSRMIKRRGAVFAFAANYFAGFEMPPHHRVAIQAQKCSRNVRRRTEAPAVRRAAPVRSPASGNVQSA